MIGVRWIDINNGDGKNVDIQSRLVAKQFKNKLECSAEQMFAATPPSDMVRVLLSRATSGITQVSNTTVAIMINDVKCAYVLCTVWHDIYIELPDENKNKYDEYKDMVGRFKLSMCGIREAAAAWQDNVNEVMTSLNFKQSFYNSCLYANEFHKVETMVHGDDFMPVGEQKSLAWFKQGLEKEFELKTSMIGWQPKMEKETRFLNRVIRTTSKRSGVRSQSTPCRDCDASARSE